MRLVNDNIKPKETAEVNLFEVFTHVLFCAFGLSTLFFSPLPMLNAQIKLEEPWPKVSILFGSVVALLFLDVPLFPVLVSFVAGMFLVSSLSLKANQHTNIWRILIQYLLVVFLVSSIYLLGASYLKSLSVLEYWTETIEWLITHLQAQFSESASFREFDWGSVRNLLFKEGFFLFLTFSLISAWVSMGMAAHFEWWKNKDAFSGDGLRKIKPSLLLSGLFFLLLFFKLFFSPNWNAYLNGFYRLIMAFLFIQGTVAFSIILKEKKAKPAFRTVLYSLLTLMGFYAVVGMGAISPLIRKRKNKNTQQSNLAINQAMNEGVV